MLNYFDKKQARLYLLLNCVLLLTTKNVIYGWREASKCTTSSNQYENSNEKPSSQSLNDESLTDNFILSSNAQNTNNLNENAQHLLELNCGTDLIFIASSHFGQRNVNKYGNKESGKFRNNNLFHMNNNRNKSMNDDSGCYFSSEDCLVTVDYVANECNGLNSCHISLDSQYLHSCKSYSDYLFIIYDCIEAKSTVNICDNTVDITKEGNISENVIYVQTPNYPNEYLRNSDCNCSMRTNRDSTIKIELLEFDMESSSSEENFVDLLTVNSKKLNGNTGSKSKLQKKQTITVSPTENLQQCLRDYFQINTYNPLCGTLKQFSSLINVKDYDAEQENNYDDSRITNFRFFSDDALTRRGFWLKIKVSNGDFYCPDNFVLVDNICLRVYDEHLTWYEAHNHCSKLGYSLALIENFELEKKMNKILYDNDDFLIKSLFGLQNKTVASSGFGKNLKSFWTGIRHLNATDWFDSKNELLNLREDERKWWPWLIVDSKTYNQGSCVAKRRDWFFLEDCYKRMPFACQTNKRSNIESKRNNYNKQSKIEFICGNRPSFSTYIQSSSTTKKSTSVSNHILPLFNDTFVVHNENLDIYLTSKKTSNFDINKILFVKNTTSSSSPSKSERKDQANEVNLALFTAKKNSPKSNSNDNTASNDSTVLISLICSIALLIAFINTLVIVLICKRKRLFLKHDEISNKNSNNSTSSGNNININLDDTNGTDNGLIDSSSTLTFGSKCVNSKSAHLFLDNSKAANFDVTSGHLIIDSTLPISFKNISLNQRHSSGIFLGEFEPNSNKTLMFTNKTLNNMNRPSNQNQKNFSHSQNKNALLINDPLSHIYETISVSSISNGNNNNNQFSNQNRTIRNSCNQNSQFSIAPQMQHLSNNQYIELDSQVLNSKNPINHHRHNQAQAHIHTNNNNEMMFFGYDSNNEHSTSSSADYSSSQQSQDSYLKILPPSLASNLTNNKSLINSFNLRNQNQIHKLNFVNANNQSTPPAASSSQSLLATVNVNEFDASMLHGFRQNNNNMNQHHFQRQQQQFQNRFTNINNKTDYLQPDVNVNFLNSHQLSNGNQAVLFTNRIEAVV